MGERQKDMGKLEIKKGKHSHLLTNILKFTIFAVVMLAPFFSVLSKCLYVACNKNAKDSYYGETINEKTYSYLNNVTLFENNEIYYLDKNGLTYNTSYSLNVYCNNFQIVDYGNLTNNQITALQGKEIRRIYFTNYNNENSLQLYYYDNSDLQLHWLASYSPTQVFICRFTITTIQGQYTSILDNTLYQILYNKYSYLDHVFEYSLQELEDTRIFNWTKNTGIYTAVNSMTTGLGFVGNSNVIALLLSYWTINTAVYIIFDIVIWAFTKITHFMQE